MHGRWGLSMRGALRTLVLAIGMALLIGCHHDKYNLKPPHVEEYNLPPDEARYNLPDTAPYRKPPAPKEDKTMTGGKQGGGMTP